MIEIVRCLHNMQTIYLFRLISVPRFHTQLCRSPLIEIYCYILTGMLMHNPESEIIAKPSEVLCSVRSMMDILQTLENYIHIDISRIFNSVLLQQTQAADGFTGEPTITQVSTLIDYRGFIMQ